MDVPTEYIDAVSDEVQRSLKEMFAGDAINGLRVARRTDFSHLARDLAGPSESTLAMLLHHSLQAAPPEDVLEEMARKKVLLVLQDSAGAPLAALAIDLNTVDGDGVADIGWMVAAGAHDGVVPMLLQAALARFFSVGGMAVTCDVPPGDAETVVFLDSLGFEAELPREVEGDIPFRLNSGADLRGTNLPGPRTFRFPIEHMWVPTSTAKKDLPASPD